MGARRGKKFGWHSGTITAQDGKFRGDVYIQDDIIFSDVSAGTLSVTGGIEFADAHNGKVIETGTYSSSASKAVTLSSSNTRPSAFLADDAGSAMTGDIRNVLSRIAITANHTGSLTLDAIRGHVKFVGGVDYDADYASGVRGYIEIAGATDFNLNSADHAVSALHGRVEVAGNVNIQKAGSYLAGLFLELNTTGNFTVNQTGILAGVVIEYTDQKKDAWGHGIYIADSAVDIGITIGTCTTGIDIGATTTGISFTGACTKGIDFSGVSGGESSASGIIMGTGTTAHPATTSTANAKFIEFRCQTTATSGDNRLMYLRYDQNGAGGGGECIRAFTKATKALGTARGAHISLDLSDTSGSCSGLGAGMDSQILAGDTAYTSGTYTAQNIEWYADGSSTDISGMTESSFIRCAIGGDSTGAANIEDNANLLVITGGSNASGNIVGAAGDEPTWTSNTYLIRCKLNGQTAYIVAVKV